MWNYYLLFAFALCTAGCGTTDSVPDAAKMPQIPSFGWTVDPGEYRSWSQLTSEGRWQIADYNSDGAVDYVRYQVPADSYYHRVWVDRDYDGYFDDYSPAPEGISGGALEINMPVPAFEPANQRLQLTDDARE